MSVREYITDRSNVPVLKSVHFSFLSTVVTAVLTYHLGWVYTVLSQSDRQMVSSRNHSEKSKNCKDSDEKRGKRFHL